jgi:cation transport regulator
MPYASNEDLPPSVGAYLPPHAQDIFRAAFNSASNIAAIRARRKSPSVSRLGGGQEELS